MNKEKSEADHLALSIYKRYYKTQSPNFELLKDTVGVISQIDNMVAGLFEDIEHLQSQLSQAREVLAFYADLETWKPTILRANDMVEVAGINIVDAGEKARQCLEEIK